MMNNSSLSLQDIRKTIVLNAPVQKVWDAVATPEGIAAWFMPNDFKPKLDYQFQLNAGPYGMSPCKVTELDPLNRLSFLWGKDWMLTFELSERDGKTEFALIHSGWSTKGVTEFDESHAIVRERMNSGWDDLLQKLRAYIKG